MTDIRKFPQQPLMDIRPDGEYINATTYIYEKKYKGGTGVKYFIQVPPGFVYDGASVPQFAWSFMPPDGLHRAASLIHDWLYVCLGRTPNGTLERKECDQIFYNMMVESGVSKWRAWLAYQAVRKFGWGYWNL